MPIDSRYLNDVVGAYEDLNENGLTMTFKQPVDRNFDKVRGIYVDSDGNPLGASPPVRDYGSVGIILDTELEEPGSVSGEQNEITRVMVANYNPDTQDHLGVLIRPDTLLNYQNMDFAIRLSNPFQIGGTIIYWILTLVRP